MNYLNKQEIDGLILRSNANILYCTKINLNHYELEGFALVTKNEVHVITDSRYKVEAQNIIAQNENIKLHIINKQSYYDLLLDVISNLNLKKIGFEENYLTMKDYSLLNKGEFELVPTTNIIENLRIIKTEEEKEIIREAYKITNNLWDHIKNFVKPNMKESDVVLEMHNFILKNGGTGFSFDPIIASGINSTKPHAGWSQKIIEDGDIITLDFGIVYKNYCTDVTKNIAIGNVNSKILKIYDLCLKANQVAFENIKAGATISQVDKISRQVIIDAGYGEYYNHSLGHGVGLQIHEQPGLSWKNNDKFKENQLITIEPGIYLPNIGGIRVESAGFVTKTGVEILTNSRKLITVK